MEEKEEKPVETGPDGERGRGNEPRIDLNDLFPGEGRDLNRLFPDDSTRKLLYQVKRNKRDIERFIKNLYVEEE